jgi:uridine kinase
MDNFDSRLFDFMKPLNQGLEDLELYEFSYALKNLQPAEGWDSVQLDAPTQIEEQLSSREFYERIQTKKKVNDRVTLDHTILRLNRMLFTGLVSGRYSVDWVDEHFYFDIRAFLFFHRTRYFTPEVISHFGGAAYQQFKADQQKLERKQEIGFRDFRNANIAVDEAFIQTVVKLVEARGTPVLLTLAGPTAAGKTEIMARLFNTFAALGKKITTLEMDNFLIDRDLRGEQPIGKATSHFDLFKESLQELRQGNKVFIPRYDFINATSSHDLNHQLKDGCTPIEVEPADVIFIEGNFPFQIPEIANLIGIKVVYLTDDPIRLKRKWFRDIDLRKKYDPMFFVNRYFKTQFLRADDCYALQMACCDILVDTTGAALWVTPQIAGELK